MKRNELDQFLLKENLNLLPSHFFSSKELEILARISSLLRFWPDEGFYSALLLSLLQFPKEFKQIRSVPHLTRQVLAEYFYKKKVLQAAASSPNKRHLYVKLLKTELEFPFGSKPVLGVSATFNLVKAHEVFEEQHIIEAVGRVLEGVREVKGSFLDKQNRQSMTHTVYLEIEKEAGGTFSLEEVERLERELPDEFKGCIEQLVPITFMKRNEEEVYRNVLALRDQLSSVKDIPQATISFDEQTQFHLFFTIVLLRVVHGKEPSVKELFVKSFPDIEILLDRIDIVGTLRKGYQKEATVFRLQLPKADFFRKDRSVNLYKARREVVHMLSTSLGQVRDYNGGLILKQNERLEDFLSIMPKIHDEFLLENFFYSITPIAMQSILPASLLKGWFLLLAELMDKELPKRKGYFFLNQKVEGAMIATIRAETLSFKDELLHAISTLAIPALELAISKVTIDGNIYFSLLYRPASEGDETRFCEVIFEAMEGWSEKMSRKQGLRIALPGNEPSLDPRVTRGDQSYILIKMLFEGLTRIGPCGKPQMAIAESYEVSEDFMSYTFHLRESKWSNGAAVSAHDFEYSWKKGLDPQAHSVYSYAFFLLKNGERAKRGEVSHDEVGVRALDSKTLLVELEYPAPYFLEVAAHWTYSLINSMVDRKYPGWAYQAGETYVCNGPFMLAEWKHSRAITVEKNPHYWDADAVSIGKISVTMLESGQNELKKFDDEELDIIGRPMGSFPKAALRSKKELTEHVSFPLQGTYSLFFNTLSFPFNHSKLRQAFAYAIDRKALFKAVEHEYADGCLSLLPKSLSLHGIDLFPNFDLKQARALFREVLGEIGIVKSDFPRLVYSYSSGTNRDSLIGLLQQQWKEAFDIDIFVESCDWWVFFARLQKGEFQFGSIEFNALWNDPLHLLECFEGTSNSFNFACWEDQQFRALLHAAKAAANIEERNLFLKEAEALLAKEMPALPLFQMKGNYLKRSELHDVSVSEHLQVDFKWARLGEKE